MLVSDDKLPVFQARDGGNTCAFKGRELLDLAAARGAVHDDVAVPRSRPCRKHAGLWLRHGNGNRREGE